MCQASGVLDGLKNACLVVRVHDRHQPGRIGSRGVQLTYVNPAALTHTSVAVLDALKNIKAPIIELHISNPHQREKFRHRSYVTQVATATIAGLGVDGYPIAVAAMAALLRRRAA